MKKSFKAAAVGLTATIMMSVVTSCYTTNSNVNSISEDDPWYNVTAIEINPGLDDSEYEYISNMFIARYDDSYVYRLEGIRNLPEDFDWENDDYSSYVISRLDFYDLNGNITGSVPVSDVVNEYDLGGTTYINTVEKMDGEIRVELRSYDMDTGEDHSYRCSVDTQNYTMSEPELIDYDFVSRLNAEDASDEGSFNIGQYTIRKYWMSGEDNNPSYVLEIIDSQDNVTELDLRELFPNTPVYDISNIVETGDDQALVFATYNGNNLFFNIDLNTMSITDVTDDMSWFTAETQRINQVEGLGCVLADDLGVQTIDFENKTLSPLFNFSDSNVNIYDISGFTPVSVTEDEAVFSGEIYPVNSSYGDSATTMIYIFNKADSNPNVGKTILRIAVVDDYTSALCSAVCLFNETNADYFIKYDDSYRLEDLVDEETMTDADEDEYELAQDRASATLGNRLTTDLLAGTGPDIIIDASTFGMLNDDDYLLDLSAHVAENFGTDRYFTNIFDAACIDGALFQLPLSFSIAGIAVPSSLVEPGQTGFTYEQYAEFVAGPCNGTNPITGGKLSLFITALNCMQDLVITGDQVDYESDAFRALAEYVSENVNDELVYDDSEGDYYEAPSEDTASMAYIDDVTEYYNAVVSGDKVLLGVPSFDGRGPIIYGSGSVAVSASSASEEGCLAFVDLLMGDEVQEYFGLQTGIPVNRAAYNSVGEQLIEYQHKSLEDLLRYYNEDMLRMYGFSTELMDEEAVETLVTTIESLSGWYSNDGAINAIIREEMPAYFEGQKTLDQVIPVLEDRVQTILNERLG